jgi:hypothetical protein
MIAGCQIDTEVCFTEEYRAARDLFLRVAGRAGGQMRAYLNQNLGPQGESLSTDIAWFGPPEAARVLVLVSAVHGVEGFCGSGAQIDWIITGGPQALPPDTAALLVHALNPHGFAWLRRTTEEGVDLNRNGLVFEAGVPQNTGYAELAEAFVPADLHDETLAAADAALDAWRDKHGDKAYQFARSTGQYTHPEGIFYGGTEPSWATRTLMAICRDYRLSSRQSVAVIDYHTGLGAYGSGEPICGHRPGESGQSRCRAWYGESLGEPLLGTSSSLPILGLTQYVWAREVGDSRLTFIALEFGTYDAETGARALRLDHVVHRVAAIDWHDPAVQKVKRDLRRFYHPATKTWEELVLFRSRQVVSQAMAGMAALA